MTGKANSVWTILVLLVLGIGFLLARLNLNLEAGDEDYRLTYTAEFHARKPDGRVTTPDARLFAAIPETTRYCSVFELDQEIDAPEMDRVRNRLHAAAAKKDIVLRADKAGEIKCTIPFRISLDRKGDWRQATADVPLTPKERTGYLAKAKGMDPTKTTAVEMISRLHDDHPGTQEFVDRIFQECREWIEPAGDVGHDSGDEALVQRKGSPLGRAGLRNLVPGRQDPRAAGDGLRDQEGQQRPAANVG